MFHPKGCRITRHSFLLSKAIDKTFIYEYNSNGNVTSVKTKTKTIHDEGTASSEIVYLYDESSMIGMLYTTLGVTKFCYFQRNLQGDVVGIYDENGTPKVKYNYDAWGNCTISSETTDYPLAHANPIRYRGYYYDEDTGLYYLNARYYSPVWRRFISPDDTAYLDPESVNGLNLYAYCNNDPVNYADPTGCFGISALIAITVASILIGATAQLVSNALAGETGSELWRGVAGAALGSGVNALALCLAIPTGGASLFIAAGVASVTQTGVDTLESIIRGEKVNWGQTVVDVFVNFEMTLLGNYVGSKIVPTNPGWFQPRNFKSVFTKSYGQKILQQTGIGAAISGATNFIKQNDWTKIIPPIVAGPKYCFYPRLLRRL